MIKLIDEFNEIMDNMNSMETGNEYTDEAIEKMNERMTQIAFEITLEITEGRYELVKVRER